MVFWIADLRGGRLGTMTRPRGGDWLADDLKQLQAEGVTMIVSLLEPTEERELELTAERTACATLGIGYLSFPISDYGVPASRREAQSFFQQVLKVLGEGQQVAVHCRQGIGRSSLVAASVLVLGGYSAADAFAHITRARGRSVPDTAEQQRWVERLTAFDL